MAGLGTLVEVRKLWTIDDLLDAIELLNMRDAAEAQAMARAKGQL